jgi:hypothetical protein
MLLMDGIRGDAKIALLTGRTADAKNAAYALGELGQVVSVSRPGNTANEQQWSELSRAFVESSLSMARSPGNDAAAVRQGLREVSQRCEACHEGR